MRRLSLVLALIVVDIRAIIKPVLLMDHQSAFIWGAVVGAADVAVIFMVGVVALSMVRVVESMVRSVEGGTVSYERHSKTKFPLHQSNGHLISATTKIE